MTGVVRWWNADRGWGFLAVDDGPDVFVHFAALKEGGDLHSGHTVEFDVVPGHVGSVAANVRVV